MTVSVSINKHTYQGNGSTTEFPCSFPLLDESHLVLYLTDPTGASSVVASGYTVNSGYVTYLKDGAPLPSDYKLTLVRQVPITQETDLTNSGGFHSEVLEESYDKLTMITQQLAEAVDRAVKVPIASGATVEELTNQILTAGSAATSAASAATSAAAIAESAKDSVLDMYNFGSDGNIIYFEPDEDGDLRPVPSTEWGMGVPMPLPLPTMDDRNKFVRVKNDLTSYEYTDVATLPIPLAAPVSGDEGKVLKVNASRTALIYAQDSVGGSGGTAAVNKIVCIGDSITAGSPYWISPDLNNPIPPPLENDLYSWVAYVRTRIGCDVLNKGIGGNTTSQILARFATDVLANTPTYCIIEGGINDRAQTDRLVDLATTQANFTSMVNQCIANGIVPIIMITTPTRQCTAYNDTFHGEVDAIRNWLYTYCSTNNIITIDGYKAFRHASDGHIIEDYFSVGTNLHPTAEGYAHLGEIVMRALQHYMLPGTLSKTDRKVIWTSPGHAAERNYASGDLLINENGTPGEFAIMAKSGSVEDVFSFLGRWRDTNSGAPNRVGYYANTSPPDVWWEVGDVVVVTTDSEVYFYGVTVAGFSASIRTPHCTTETIAVLPKSAGSLTPTWYAPTLLNSWANSGGANRVAGYCKDAMGIVHLRGVLTGGTNGTTIFTLPAGYRPASTEFFAVVANASFAPVVIQSDGTVMLTAGSPTLSLCGITFVGG